MIDLIYSIKNNMFDINNNIKFKIFLFQLKKK